jgi:signal transduction histidine kinase
MDGRARQEWLQSGEVGLSEAMRGDKSVEQLGEDILAFLAEHTGLSGGALFKGESGHFRRAAVVGVPADANMPSSFNIKEGLLGKVAVDGKALVLEDVPEGYLTIGSAFGRDKPRHLVIVPAKADAQVNAVLELGFFKPVDPLVLDLLERVSPAVGIALRSARFRARLQDALEETQRQAGELQAQSEELRVSNEELEEQGRALRDPRFVWNSSRSNLNRPTASLRNRRRRWKPSGTNWSGPARRWAPRRTNEQASQYKSDFLANMSHELRTPLNSLLILSKLLGDNSQGNLSDEQIKYANTIESSGNDLLTLINDILDLSKIEAGHIEIRPETVALQRLTGDLRRTFDPLAEKKGLGFDISLSDDCARTIESDRMRLEQILKNLLSNAFKFTERGQVSLAIERVDDASIRFAVSDTGIGISAEQQASIFEAFHQADATISRKFGGTGLGLSISRELARLLGGRIALESRPGEGSTFTLTIPLAYETVAQPTRRRSDPGPAPVAVAPAIPCVRRPRHRLGAWKTTAPA